MFQWLNGRKLQIAASTVACALALGGGVALSGQAAPDTVTFTLQAKTVVHSTTGDPSHPRDGDDVIFYATLSENGKVVGRETGLKVVVRNAADPSSTDLASAHGEERLSFLDFKLGGNDSLIAEGVALDRPDGLLTGEADVRAITGGTGKYKFAHGQVTSTRNADGTYTQTFELRM